MRNPPGGPELDTRHRWRAGLTSRLLAAALSGVAEALEDRRRERPPEVVEAADPPDDGWLVLLDRDVPARSLVVLPARLSSGGASADPDPATNRGHAGPARAGPSGEGEPPATVPAR